jgi:hypothetical protein
MQLDMGCSFNFTSGIGGENRGVVTFTHFNQSLLDTLDINGHGIHSASNNNRFSGHEVACMGNAVAGKHFRPGAAHTNQVDPFSARAFSGFDQSRFIDRR